MELPAEIQEARIEAAEAATEQSRPALADAERKLRRAHAAAQRLGYYEIGGEASLALAELEMGRNPAAARAALAALAAVAHRRGFERLARRAGAQQQ